MAWPLVLMGAGMMMQTFGQLKANSDQARAERENAFFFREQGAFQEEATERAVKVFQSKSTTSLGNTVGAYAKGGVTLSASALEVIGGQKAKIFEEESAIRREGQFRARLAYLRANQAEQTADSLTSPENTFLTMFGGGLQTAGAMSKG